MTSPVVSSAPVFPVAIVGVAFRLPGDISDPKMLWESLLQGADLVTEVDPSRWATEELQHPKRAEPGRSITFSAGVLSRIDEFDAGFFGISPREAAWVDPQQRLLLELAWESMENAGIPASRMAGSNCAVYVGISGLDYGIRALDDLPSFSAHTMTGNTLSIAANRLSYVFDLHGPSMAVDTACSSSLVALHQACNCLQAGDANMAMVGGVNMLTHPYPFVGFTKASMLSARGRCHTFDASGDGYVRAEGGAVLLLKPLAQAEADGDFIHAVIMASGANADGGRKTGLTIPSGEGQIELMRHVLAKAGIAPEALDYLEAHGTGTSIGDPIETSAIAEVYGRARASDNPLPIGSIKSNVGHLEPASGMAGLMKALLVLKHRQVPPSIHLQTRNPKIDFDGWHLRPVTEPMPLQTEADKPLLVGVNSFGFGGANAHVILSEYRNSVATTHLSEKQFPPLLLSAKTTEALREMAVSYSHLLKASPVPAYYDVAYAAAYRRERLEKRLLLRADSIAAVCSALDAYGNGQSVDGLVTEDAPIEAGKLAFIYAGNGAQWVGMGQMLYAESEAFAACLNDLDARIKKVAGFSVIDELMATGEASRMADTAVAQPLLFALQVALSDLLKAEGLVPDAVAGHSVGEVAAAWAAGALTLDEAVTVICARSAAQALTRGAGRMAAISIAYQDMQNWLASGNWPDIEIAGINSPANLTLSGPLEQLQSLSSYAKEKSVVFRLLDLDYAFHSRCMDPVKETLAVSLNGFSPEPENGPVFVSTVTGDVCTTSLGAEYWWDNVRCPVKFQQAVEQMLALGCRIFVEIAPHAILQRYLKECASGVGVKSTILPSLKKNDDGIDVFSHLVLRLHLLNQKDTLSSAFPVIGNHVCLPAYPWQKERHWLPNTVEGYKLIERRRVHPLLGWPLKDADTAWENVLDPKLQPWLLDHQVGGAIVLPGAAYLEMALAAARHIYGQEALEIEEIDIVSPVVFDGEHGRSIRFEFNHRDGAFQIRSRQRMSEDDWSLNASGRLLGAVSGYIESQLLRPETTLSIIDQAQHYELAHRLGLDYGPVFQGLSEVSVGRDLLCGTFASPLLLGAEDENWYLHPGIVDVCFQSLLDFFEKEILQDQALPLLPVKVGRLRYLTDRPVTQFRTQIKKRGLRSVLADFELLDETGQQVALLSQCRFRAASLKQSRQADAACWETVPSVRPGISASQSSAMPAPAIFAESLQVWLADHEEELGRQAYFDEAQPLLDALVTAFAYEGMRSALAEPTSELLSALEMQGDLSSASIVVWIRDLLVEQGLLGKQAESWVLHESDLPPAEEIWRTLLAEYPSLMPELVLIGRKGKTLAALLSGTVDPATMASELRSSHQLETQFDDSLTYSGLRHGLQAVIADVIRQYPANRRIRILECSEGLTDIPRSLAHEVQGDAVDYVIAHRDLAACDQLRHEYHEEAWVHIAEWDAEQKQLKSKDNLPVKYDLILLRHCLNTLSDPHAELLWAKSQLAAGGMLVIAERYPDLATRMVWDNVPFVTPRTWEAELAEIGLIDPLSFREPAGQSSQVGAYLVLAAEPADSTEAQEMSVQEPLRWVFVTQDDQGFNLAEQIRGACVDRGQAAISLKRTSAFLSVSDADLLIQQVTQELDGAPDRLIWFVPKVSVDEVRLPIEGLNLVQSLSKLKVTPQLSIVTTGACPVSDMLPADQYQPAQTALWGFGRVVMNEYPAFMTRLLDIDAAVGVNDNAGLLIEELLCPDGESEVLLYPQARYGLRMQPTVLPNKQAKEESESRYRLDFRVPGQLRNLVWLKQPDVALGPDEVEVIPVATGLNFRDIMYVMGLLPDEAVEHGFAGASLGLEFSGVVHRVGSKVDEYVPGDAVMGFGSACFASHVKTRANALTPKPEGWSFEAAASVPTVFFTVYYALKQLANLQPGERVLIHGGAGGVGIAAIQLARHLGAEVFATAGSNEKRQFVELLGADRVFDSRSLAYADQILAATNGEGVDVVLNSLAGEAIRRNLRVLRPFGRFLELGKRDFFENTPIGLRPFKDNISYFGIDADQLLVARPDLAGKLFREVMGLFRNGILSPLPVRAFPAEQVVDAFRYMQQARQIGKVIVTFDRAKIKPEPVLPEQHEIRFDADGCYLVTGGLSGFGLETARWLAKNGAGQLLLLSRQGNQTEGAASVVAELSALGADVIVAACDVADRQALLQVLNHKSLRVLKGIFHAAMVIEDLLMANLDPEKMRRVLQPKVQGGWNLHELTKQHPLDFFMLYSSVTTYIGNPGQANYVAANAWLEGLANLRRAEGRSVTCIGWGPIGDAGYLTRNQAVKDSLASRLGAEPLLTSTALSMLGRLLVEKPCNLSVGDFQFASLARLLPSSQGARFELLRQSAQETLGAGGDADDFKVAIEGKSQEEVQRLVQQLVTQEVAQILAVSPERIDPVRSLHDLGLDSLMGVELALGLEKRFGIQIPAMVLNEGPTVERVTTRIVERLFAQDSGEEGATLTETAHSVAAIHGETLSEEMVKALVADIEKG